MAPLSAKNAMISPASVDLGLGAGLSDQLKQEEEEKRKKLMGLKNKGSLPGAYGDNVMSPAAMDLGLTG